MNNRLIILLAITLCIYNIHECKASDTQQSLSDNIISFGSSIKPSKHAINSEYDDKQAPIQVDKADIKKKISNLTDNMFFTSFTMNGEMHLEFDSFLIPNGDYSKIEVQWENATDQNGNNIIRSATDKEQENDKMFRRKSWERIYYSGENKPDTAWGKMKVDIPVEYQVLHFDVTEIGKSKQNQSINAILNQCENDIASITITGEFDKDSVIPVFYDKCHGNLKQDSSAIINRDGYYSINCRVKGTIDSIDIFLPVDYWSESFDIMATSKPEMFGDNKNRPITTRFQPENRHPDFRKTNLETLKKNIQIVSRRGYAFYGFNQPRILAKLPQYDNSCYAKVKLADLKLYDEHDNTIEHKTGSYFNYDIFQKRFDIKSSNNDDSIIEFRNATGTVNIKYPAEIKTITLTKENNQLDGITAYFDGKTVGIGGIGKNLSYFNLPERAAIVKAYNSDNLRIKSLNYTGTKTINGNEQIITNSFWGEPSIVKVTVVKEWLESTMPFNVTAAPKLPESQRGQKPIDY